MELFKTLTLLALCSQGTMAAESRNAAQGIQVLEIAGSACSGFIADTWSIEGDRLALENNRIYTCTNKCKDPQLHGIDVTEGVVQKFNLKDGSHAETLNLQCKANPKETRKRWPAKCEPNNLDIFKVMLPFTGTPSQICFCEDQDRSRMALCRKVGNTDQPVAILADEPTKRILDSACQVTSISGAGVACLCSQQHPNRRKEYFECLRSESSVTAIERTHKSDDGNINVID